MIIVGSSASGPGPRPGFAAALAAPSRSEPAAATLSWTRASTPWSGVVRWSEPPRRRADAEPGSDPDWGSDPDSGSVPAAAAGRGSARSGSGRTASAAVRSAGSGISPPPASPEFTHSRGIHTVNSAPPARSRAGAARRIREASPRARPALRIRARSSPPPDGRASLRVGGRGQPAIGWRSRPR